MTAKTKEKIWRWAPLAIEAVVAVGILVGVYAAAREVGAVNAAEIRNTKEDVAEIRGVRGEKWESIDERLRAVEQGVAAIRGALGAGETDETPLGSCPVGGDLAVGVPVGEVQRGVERPEGGGFGYGPEARVRAHRNGHVAGR